MIRCYVSRNDGMSVLERKYIGQLFFKIAEVLEIQNEDVACAIDFFTRKSLDESAANFSLTETNPYKINLANLLVEPRLVSGPMPYKNMGRNLAHEMIHLKQSLRDGLAAIIDPTGLTATRLISFKGQTFGADELNIGSARRHLPFEKEAHASMGDVYRQAVEAKSQIAHTTSAHDPKGNYAEATVMFLAGYYTVEHEQAVDAFSELQKHLECVQRRYIPARGDEQLQVQQKAVWAAARKVAKHAETPAMGGDLEPCVHKDIAELKLALDNHDQWAMARGNLLMSELKKSLEKFKRTSYDPLKKDMEKALERQRREGKRYRKGDKVYIINHSVHGPYYFEGRATVIRPVGVGGRYFVDFGNGPVQRFINDKAQENLGNEIDRLNRETDRGKWD